MEMNLLILRCYGTRFILMKSHKGHAVSKPSAKRTLSLTMEQPRMHNALTA